MTRPVIIETPRLVLRPPEMADWEAFGAFLGSDRAVHIGGPYSRPKAWRAFGHVVGHWVLRGFGVFVCTEKATGAPVCSVGPWFPEGHAENEIAWSVWTAEAEGKGFAFEAALAARNWAYETLGWSTCVSYIDEANTRSAALARRMGCVIDAEAPRLTEDGAEDIPYNIWRHPAPDADGSAEAYS